MSTIIEAGVGESIHSAAIRAVVTADETDNVSLYFNGTVVPVNAGDVADEVVSLYWTMRGVDPMDMGGTLVVTL